MIIIDAHEDIAFNVLVDGRNYLQSAYLTRTAENGTTVPESTGICMLGLPEWIQARVAVIFATLTTIPRGHARPGEMSYGNIEASYQQALAQLAIYRRWSETTAAIRLITDQSHLNAVLASWEHEEVAPQTGLALLMENADSIRTPEEIGFWYEQGLRIVGPAWHTNRFTGSTMDAGPLTAAGRALLAAMGHFGMALDLSHMAEEACLEALATYPGPILASHANPRRMAPIARLLSDKVIAEIIARDGVIGIMPVSWALVPNWRQKPRAEIGIDLVAQAIDIVCQIAGDAHHVGLGTDFDGGQGAECAPAGIETVADLPLIAVALEQRGYASADIEAILHGNWLRILRQTLPSEPSVALT
ncbi:MAG: dipeptidase [Nitrososphaerota archaeon]